MALSEEVWPCWKRCGLVRGGLALSEEVWLCRRDCVTRGSVLGSQKLKALNFLLPAYPDVELSATTPAPCLLVYHHASHHDNNEQNLNL